MRYFTIAGFHLRTASLKIIIVMICFPMFLIMIPWWCFRGESDWGSFLEIFNPKEWTRNLGNMAEVGFGCRWYLFEAKRNIKGCNLPYSYYDDDIDVLGFLFLEDAILANMSYGGRVIDKKACKKIMRGQGIVI